MFLSDKDIDLKVFYVSSERAVYVVWKKKPLTEEYIVYKNDNIIARTSDPDIDISRPYEFDNDHHTELFVDQSSHHWLRFRDTDVKNFTHYSYRVTAFNEIGEVIATSIKPVDTE